MPCLDFAVAYTQVSAWAQISPEAADVLVVRRQLQDTVVSTAVLILRMRRLCRSCRFLLGSGLCCIRVSGASRAAAAATLGFT